MDTIWSWQRWAIYGADKSGHYWELAKVGTIGSLLRWSLLGVCKGGHYRELAKVSPIGIWQRWALSGAGKGVHNRDLSKVCTIGSLQRWTLLDKSVRGDIGNHIKKAVRYNLQIIHKVIRLHNTINS